MARADSSEASWMHRPATPTQHSIFDAGAPGRPAAPIAMALNTQDDATEGNGRNNLHKRTFEARNSAPGRPQSPPPGSQCREHSGCCSTAGINNQPSVAPGAWGSALGWRTGHSALLQEACPRAFSADCRRPACHRGRPAATCRQPAQRALSQARGTACVPCRRLPQPPPHTCPVWPRQIRPLLAPRMQPRRLSLSAQRGTAGPAQHGARSKEGSQQGSKRTRQQAQTCSGPAAWSAMPATRPCAWLNARPNSARHSSPDRGGAVWPSEGLT